YPGPVANPHPLPLAAVAVRLSSGGCGEPGERIPGHVFRDVVGSHDVVLDANPAVGPQSLHHAPVDMAAARVVASGLQQRIDEKNAGLDRHHDARLEHPREPQIGMSLGPRALSALRIAHHAADVVYLEPQQMTDAV